MIDALGFGPNDDDGDDAENKSIPDEDKGSDDRGSPDDH